MTLYRIHTTVTHKDGTTSDDWVVEDIQADTEAEAKRRAASMLEARLKRAHLSVWQRYASWDSYELTADPMYELA